MYSVGRRLWDVSWSIFTVAELLTIGPVQPIYGGLCSSLLDNIEHRLVLLRELRASLQGVDTLVGGEEAARRIEISLGSAEIDIEDLLQVVDYYLRVDSGRGGTGRS